MNPIFSVLCLVLFTNGICVQAFGSLGVSFRSIVPDYRMQASSENDERHAPKFGRLDETSAGGSAVASWVPIASTLGQWIQVDLGKPTKVVGVVTQGRGTADQWVKTFTVGCMMEDDMTVVAGSDGNAKVFPGNNDRNTHVTNLFDAPITCRYVRFYPQTFNNFMSMRVDVLVADCN